MKKTLLLLALLGVIPAQAETLTVFAEGYDASNIQSAYHTKMVGNMCWGANASNIMAWWQDQLVEQGYTLPQSVPTGSDLYPEYQAAFETIGGNTDSALEWWLNGYYHGQTAREGHKGGYYGNLLLPMEHNSYSSEGTMIKQFFPATYGTLEAYSAQVKDCLANGYALAMRVSKGYNITVWGADYDTTTGLLTHLYYTDPHDTEKIWHGELYKVDGVEGSYTFSLQGGMGTISTTTGIPCHIEEYLTKEAYTDTGSGAFAPHYNVEVGGGNEYSLSKAMAAGGKANADVTITNGSVKITGQGSTEGAVIFSQGEEYSTRKLSVQRTGLTLSSVKVDAVSGNTLEVTTGNDVSITQMTGAGTLVKTGTGTLVNSGSLGNLIVQEGIVKGSGTFAAVTVDGGTLIVGNSPGQQTYTGNLAVNAGDIVFSVSDWESAATDQLHGWDAKAYSNLVMNNNNLTFGEGANIKFAVGGEALNALLSGKGGFSMDIATGLGNGEEYFNSELLEQLALETTFYVADENGALVNGAGLNAGDDLTSRIYNLAYALEGTTLRLTGSFEQQVVPEPTTGTLSLFALAGLCARRRKK